MQETSSDKTFIKCEAMIVQKLSQTYYTKWTKWQQSKIQEYKFENITYHMIHAKKISNIAWSNKCHLITVQDGIGIKIGYAYETEGFPFYQGVPPIFKKKVAIQEVIDTEEEDDDTIVLKIKGEENPWKFKLGTKYLVIEWINLMFKLKDLCQIKTKPYDNRQVTNDIQFGVKQKQRIIQRRQGQIKIPQERNILVSCQQVLYGINSINFIQLSQEKEWINVEKAQWKLKYQNKQKEYRFISNLMFQANQNLKISAQQNRGYKKRISQLQKELKTYKQVLLDENRILKDQVASLKEDQKQINISKISIQNFLNAKVNEIQQQNQRILVLQGQINQTGKHGGGQQVGLKLKQSQIELDQTKNNLEKCQRDQNIWIKEKSQLQTTLSHQQLQIQRLLAEAQTLRNISAVADSSRMDVEKLEQRLKSHEEEQKRYSQKIIILQHSLSSQQQKNRQLVQKHHQMSTQYERMKRLTLPLEEQNYALKQQLAHSRNGLLFHGKLLVDQPKHKQFLQHQIQLLKKQKIVRTELIFAADPHNPTSFHKYIDQISDIVLVIKTENDIFIGGYSESSLSGKSLANQRGVIVSLTDKKVFALLEGKRSVTYDNFFLIFGNSEIRLKQGEWKVFCNFGIANGFFNAKGATVNDLLKAGTQREVKITGYQVHRVLFE